MLSIIRIAILATAMLSGLAASTPISNPQGFNMTLIPSPKAGNTSLSTDIHHYYCTNTSSTFQNQGSNVSPLVSDCQQLMANIDKGGSWLFNDCTQHTEAQYYSCKFGVESSRSRCINYMIQIGNGDIIDAIQGSIDRYQRNDGRVGALGYFECQTLSTFLHTVTVQWGLY